MGTKPEPVRCQCGTLFGYATGNTLAIKHRDLYRTVTGGRVEGPCRRCGAIVRWPTEPTISKTQ